MNIDLQNKVIVITGSSKGIGHYLAKKFAEENAKVIINYCKSEKSAYNLHNELIINNKKSIVIKADITKVENVNKLYEETIATFGKVDVLINNAGICADNCLQSMTEKQWDNVINTNLKGTFLCCKIFSKNMINQGYGKIFNIASLKGQVGYENQVNYSASKAGVIGMTKALAKELGKYNIAVNAICPGFITTDLNKNDQYKQEVAVANSLLSIKYSLADLTHFLIYASSDMFMGISGRIFNLDSRL